MQYYEVNIFRIRSSNSQQLESKCIDHPWTLEKKGEWRGRRQKKVLQLSQPHLWCSWWANSLHKSNHFLLSSFESTRGSTIASCFLSLLCSASLSSWIENDFFFVPTNKFVVFIFKLSKCLHPYMSDLRSSVRSFKQKQNKELLKKVTFLFQICPIASFLCFIVNAIEFVTICVLSMLFNVLQ